MSCFIILWFFIHTFLSIAAGNPEEFSTTTFPKINLSTIKEENFEDEIIEEYEGEKSKYVNFSTNKHPSGNKFKEYNTFTELLEKNIEQQLPNFILLPMNKFVEVLKTIGNIEGKPTTWYNQKAFEYKQCSYNYNIEFSHDYNQSLKISPDMVIHISPNLKVNVESLSFFWLGNQNIEAKDIIDLLTIKDNELKLDNYYEDDCYYLEYASCSNKKNNGMMNILVKVIQPMQKVKK